ncbi:MAG: DUF1553 domain-containing protein [Phycisphaera sp.]|nr:DUF1553 domain-containing protein [Phycisphaera sp.]
MRCLRNTPLTTLLSATTLSLTMLTVLTPTARAVEPVDFARDIKPLLDAQCMKCHGREKRKGGVLLTYRAAAMTESDLAHKPIVPGDPDASEMIRRLTLQDDDERMPPSKAPLKAEEVDLLRRWIKEGAVWPDDGSHRKHWAYIKPVRPELPAVSDASWCRTPIDRFVLARLDAEKLTPSREEDPAKLLRRVYLDLIGIPPTPEEADAFLADQSPEAYEKVVDRLLASPRYGEKWARQWLDLARYADSNGFQADQIRENWAYRDWVIKAMNADMPFDEFTIDQLAGDLLPDATVDTRVATGFHRLTTCNVEAGVHPEENRTNQVFDRVNTTGTVWLGTTIECCQCHSHKYDPFTQNEYYQLFAYFNNTPLEVKQKAGVTFDFVGPKMALPLPEQQRGKYADLHGKYAALKAKYDAATTQAAADQKRWERDAAEALRHPPKWTTLRPAAFETTGGETYEVLDDGSVLLGGTVPGTTVYTFTAQTSLTNITGFKIETLTDDSLPGKGPGRGDEERSNFVLNEFTVTAATAKTPGKAAPVKLTDPRADYSQPNWDVGGLIDGNGKTGWAIADQFHKPHWATFQTDKPLNADGGETVLTFTLDQNFGRGRVIGRLRLSALTGSGDALGLPKEVATLLMKDDKRSKKEQKVIDDYYAKANPVADKIRSEMEAVKRELDNIEPPTTLVMVEMDKPRETHVMMRGNYLHPGQEVEPGTPATLHPLDPDLPKNRLGFAQWLMSPENPLTARVTVNRWWAAFMSRGIVATQEDFGTQCEPPTHPKLLDWLAVEFIESGWSMKHMHKLIAMSAAYRQSSKVTPELVERDPVNLLYARGPRFRLSAEQIRDSALRVSGLLSEKMYGEPVYPPQPPGIWRQVGRNEPKFNTSTGEDRFRRGVYVIWRRAAPYPSMVNFDAPDRAACVPNRARTNTPLQALTLLNDEAYVEMGLALAARVMQDRAGADTRDKVTYAFRRVLVREPTSFEAEHLAGVYERELAQLKKSPKEAEELIRTVKGYTPPKQLDHVELAAWFRVANVLLNLDETVTKG